MIKNTKFESFFSPLVISDECTTHELIAEKCTWISETCLETDNLSDVTVKKSERSDPKTFSCVMVY